MYALYVLATTISYWAVHSSKQQKQLLHAHKGKITSDLLLVGVNTGQVFFKLRSIDQFELNKKHICTRLPASSQKVISNGEPCSTM